MTDLKAAAKTLNSTARPEERIILVKLSVSQWYPTKLDKKASAEIARSYGAAAAERVGHYTKYLVDLSTVKPIQQRIRRLREDHYALTVPWGHDGQTALPAELYHDYVAMVAQAKDEIAGLVREFEVAYGEQRINAAIRLGRLFSSDDYPEPEEVAERFQVRTKFRPLENADDVRVWGISAKATEEIRAEIEAEAASAVREAQAEVIDRVVTKAREFIEKTRKYHSGEAKKYHGTAVDNLRDIVDLVLRGLNVTGDAGLTKLAEELSDALGDITPTQIKAFEIARVEKTNAVEDVLKRFKGALF